MCFKCYISKILETSISKQFHKLVSNKVFIHKYRRNSFFILYTEALERNTEYPLYVSVKLLLWFFLKYKYQEKLYFHSTYPGF